MITTRPVLYAVAALALLVSACGSDSNTSTAASSTTAATTASTTATSAASTASTAAATSSTAAPRVFPATGGTLKLVDDPKLGKVLADGAGNVLYLYTPDKQGASTCYDKCEKAWPVTGKADGVAAGLDAKLLGTTTRTNGAVQATYGGWPLYYFANDKAPGDSKGQGLNNVWYVLDAAGKGVGLPG